MKAQRNQRALGKGQGAEKTTGRWGKTTGRWVKRQGAAPCRLGLARTLGSVEGRRMYLFHCDFSSCSESEIWHAHSFSVKKCTFVFFSQAGKQGFKHALESPPPLLLHPPSNGVKHTHAQCFTSQRLKYGHRGRVDFYEIWSIVFCLLEKRKLGHFLTQKESACGQISVDSKQLEKSLQNRYIRLPCGNEDSSSYELSLSSDNDHFII